jgi:hypothetical protein
MRMTPRRGILLAALGVLALAAVPLVVYLLSLAVL